MYGVTDREERRRLMAADARRRRAAVRAYRKPHTAEKWRREDRAIEAFLRQARRVRGYRWWTMLTWGEVL